MDRSRPARHQLERERGRRLALACGHHVGPKRVPLTWDPPELARSIALVACDDLTALDDGRAVLDLEADGHARHEAGVGKTDNQTYRDKLLPAVDHAARAQGIRAFALVKDKANIACP